MRILKSFASIKFPLPQIIYLVVVFTFFRVTFEEIFLDYPLELDFFQRHARLYLENIFFFIILFILLVFFISQLAQKKFFEVANFGIKIFPMMMVPPLIDHFFFNRTAGYIYGSVGNFWSNVMTFSFRSGEAGTGISILIAMTTTAVSGYVYYNRRSLALSLLALFGTSFLIVGLSTPEFFFGGHADYFFAEFLPNYYFFPLLILTGITAYALNKKKFIAVIMNLRLVRSLIFVTAVLLGSLSMDALGFAVKPYEIFLVMVSVFFSWEFSVFINDIYDQKIDRISNSDRPLPRKILSVSEYKFISAILAFFSLSFAAIINIPVFLASATWLLLGIVYSKPPFRFRKNFSGNFIIGIALSISFIMGLLATGDYPVLSDARNIKFSIIVLIFGSLLSLIKDIKDIEGDKKNGIKNLFTALGRNKGKKATVGIIFAITAIVPIVFFQDFHLSLIALLFGSLISYLYHKKESINLSYILSVLEVVFIFLFLYNI